MKTLRQFCIVLAFTLALMLPAFAGEITTGIAPPPPVQPQTATLNGDIQTGVTGQAETDSSEATAADSATEIALNLLQSMLALF